MRSPPARRSRSQAFAFPACREKTFTPLRARETRWREAAMACRLALEADFGGHEAFNICAPTTFMNTPTDELLQRYLPEVRCLKRSPRSNWAGYDSSKAERILGFKARYLVAP